MQSRCTFFNPSLSLSQEGWYKYQVRKVLQLECQMVAVFGVVWLTYSCAHNPLVIASLSQIIILKDISYLPDHYWWCAQVSVTKTVVGNALNISNDIFVGLEFPFLTQIMDRLRTEEWLSNTVWIRECRSSKMIEICLNHWISWNVIYTSQCVFLSQSRGRTLTK